MRELRNPSQGRLGRLGAAVMATTVLLPLAACAPIIFEDKSALTIVGDPPPPPPKPEPVVEKPKRVEVQDDRIIINEVIQFEFNKATILPVSDSLLDEIAKIRSPGRPRLCPPGERSTRNRARSPD